MENKKEIKKEALPEDDKKAKKQLGNFEDQKIDGDKVQGGIGVTFNTNDGKVYGNDGGGHSSGGS